MATTIEGATVVTRAWRSRHSALRLADAATRGTLHRTGRAPGEVELLINAGLYRDHNLGEPALAPLIQEDVGAHPEDPVPGEHGTFSLDVANGGCGVLTALQVADGFLSAGTIATAVVVASDADPGHGLAPSFPFRPAGGALLCRWTDGPRGLGSFRWQVCPDDGDAFRATVAPLDGRNVLTVREDPAFADRAGRGAAAVAEAVLADHGLASWDLDLVVASPARPAFTKALSAGLGIPEDQVVTAGPTLHTAAFVAALEVAADTGRLGAAEVALFVCGGAGITAGAALYRP
ncbi:MAG TPA: 3-oxoacyl-[acyl-carrier-protein] synthase III C-terminal domain-containing protein [Acidimicrobiales bacterium]|nr:3-oxoacyl-[acyl-carrier-protein] synthase III C-terminal domain-containing protein [Acidimicrobiales bacterium]